MAGSLARSVRLQIKDWRNFILLPGRKNFFHLQAMSLGLFKNVDGVRPGCGTIFGESEQHSLQEPNYQNFVGNYWGSTSLSSKRREWQRGTRERKIRTQQAGYNVMNQVQPNVDTNVIQVVIRLTRAIGPRTSNRASCYIGAFIESTLMVDLDRFTGTGNPDDWIFRAEQYFTYLGFPENDWLPLPFFYLDGEALDWFRWDVSQQTILGLETFQGKKVQDNFSVMSKQLDNTHISTSSISNITGLSPTIIQEASIEDAIGSATTRVSEEIASALGDGQSSIAHNFEVHLETFDTLIDPNLLLAGTDLVMGDEHSGHADQATQVISKPTWCAEIDNPNDKHSRKSIVEEDECLETKRHSLVVTDKFFSHVILISDFDEPIGVDGYVSLIPHDDVAAISEFFPFVFNQSSLADFGDLAMCQSVTDGLPTCHWFDTGQHVSPFIPFVFRLTRYGHHVSATEFDKNDHRPIIGSQGSDILILAIRCSSYHSSGDNSKIAWEGASHYWSLEMLSRYILAMESGNSKMDQLFDAMSDEACKVFNVLSTSLLVRVLAETPKETGTIQLFHFKDKACLLISFGGQESIVSAAHSTHALPMRYFDVNSLYSVLSRQKIDLVASNNMYVDIIFMKSTIVEDVSKREIQSNDVRNDVEHVHLETFDTLIDPNLLLAGTDLVMRDEHSGHADQVFDESSHQIEDSVHEFDMAFDLVADNLVGLQIPLQATQNLFMLKLGGTVKVNCVWDPRISSKIMHRNGLMETIDAHLLLEFIVTISLLFNFFYDAHLKGNTQSTKRRMMTAKGLSVFPYFWLSLSQDNGWQVLLDVCVLGAKNMPTLSVKPSSQIKPLGAWSDKCLTVEVIMQHQKVSTDQYAYWCLKMIYISPDDISFWVDTHTSVCPMSNINCMCGFECIYVAGVVTFKWAKVVQSTQLLLSEAIDTNVIQVVIRMTRAIGPKTSNRARLIWDPD
ncbi:hypothetical protein H5410_048623 [Solanum commersonii]|uniref:Uncharacterized protein n=1 Tax=Solanum commersonii TaxID=4109 RepID=A0A9J5XK66_SOLCO|nr:hypothetical protein H5410_048623 [Solanum commersonii]